MRPRNADNGGIHMISPIPGLPEDVIGFEASGKVTDADYEQVLIPAVQAALERDDDLRFLYVLGRDFDGYSASAMWDDTKVGLKHWGSWERIAVVTDDGTYQGMVKAFGFLMPGKVKVFALDEQAAAAIWVAADDDDDDDDDGDDD